MEQTFDGVNFRERDHFIDRWIKDIATKFYSAAYRFNSERANTQRQAEPQIGI